MEDRIALDGRGKAHGRSWLAVVDEDAAMNEIAGADRGARETAPHGFRPGPQKARAAAQTGHALLRPGKADEAVDRPDPALLRNVPVVEAKQPVAPRRLRSLRPGGTISQDQGRACGIGHHGQGGVLSFAQDDGIAHETFRNSRNEGAQSGGQSLGPMGDANQNSDHPNSIATLIPTVARTI